MPVPIELPVLITQMAEVQKLTHFEQTNPEVQQIVAGMSAEQMRKQQKRQIQQTQQSEKSNKVDDEKQGRGEKREAGSKKRREQSEEPEEDQRQKPFSGLIINKTI